MSERSDAELIREVLKGDQASFEPLVVKYQGKVFATARRYAPNPSEAEDIVQEVFLKAFTKLGSFRGESPFEHWLMRLAVRTCFDHLRAKQRKKEYSYSELNEEQAEWLEQQARAPELNTENQEAVKSLVEKILSQLSPASRMVITLLEIEDRTIKEISEITGWSLPLVKVRAFRARAEMKKLLGRIAKDKYL
ncbi:MAG: RNA polymerase sigma factor [Verrucomicrobiales bacterium]